MTTPTSTDAGKERAAVIAWLNAVELALYRQGQHTYAAICMKWAAEVIEAGDHITTGQEEGA